jgi:spermidine synthase
MQQQPARPWLIAVAAVLFFASGAAGLMYEIAWSRRLALVFGTTLPAVTAVLAAFMGGLALGSAIFGRVADRSRRLLGLYGVLEIGIGLYALAFEPLVRWVERSAPVWAGALGEGSASLDAARFVGCLLLLLLPTSLMGGTLPVLGRALLRSREHLGSRLGLLYGINTLGAVVGTALAGFVLLRWVGLSGTLAIGGAVNLTVGLAAVALELLVGTGPAGLDASPAPKGPAERGPGLALLGLAYGLCGFAALVCQIAWTRALLLVLGTSVYAFTVMLSTFLTGLALGGALAGRLADRARSPWQAFGVIEWAIGLFVLLSAALLSRLPVLYLEMFAWASKDSFWALQLVAFSLAAAVMLVPTLLMGAAFPVAARLALADGKQVGTRLGDLYWANTLGGILGAVTAGFWIIPAVGTRATLQAAAGIFMAVGLAVLARDRSVAPARRVLVVGLLVLLGVAMAVSVPPWERMLMSSGVYVYAPQLEDGFRAQQKFLYFNEGRHSLVAVTEAAGIRSLRINGKTDGSDGEDMVTQVLLAQLPMLVHPRPARVMIVGLGTGVTAGSAAAHEGTEVDCLEIDPDVIAASRLFSDVNGGALDHPRVRVLEVDARTWLSAGGPEYDVLISEPSNPWITGVSNLFTLEHFAASRRRLVPGGVMCQWVHSYYMSLENLRLILRTFLSVFPDASLWHGAEGDFLVLGRTGPLPGAQVLRTVSEGFAALPIRQDLARIGVVTPQQFLRRQLLTPRQLRAFVGEGPINTDNRPLVEFLSPLSMYRDSHDENLRALREAATN